MSAQTCDSCGVFLLHGPRHLIVSDGTANPQHRLDLCLECWERAVLEVSRVLLPFEQRRNVRTMIGAA